MRVYYTVYYSLNAISYSTTCTDHFKGARLATEKTS